MTERMNPEVKAKWLTALRSGEYKQAQEKLHDVSDDSFCCLGVLCDLYRKEHSEAYWGEDGVFSPNPGAAVFGSDIGMHVNGWAGARVDGYRDWKSGERNSLAEYNDGGSTFAEIADLIEEHL